MSGIMAGEASEAQVAGLLMGLAARGETVTEIAAAARVMRRLARRVEVDPEGLTDIVGTGGDGMSLFNVSTAAAFAAAAGGARIAKHGNRSVSSRSGAADVLEAAGVKLELEPDRVAAAVEELGIGFLFAPVHHGAMRHAAAPRRALGVRTLFNLLGPLTNPAGATRMVLGVYDRRWLEPMAAVLAELGARHVLVVHSEDGLDELSIAKPTHIAELRDGTVRTRVFDPSTIAMPIHGSLSGLSVSDADESLELVRTALGGTAGPAADMVALNAGAALYVAGLAGDIPDGIRLAREVLASGSALDLLERYAEFTRGP